MIEIPERVKDALRDGRMLKNYRFNVLKDDGTLDFAIENENLVSESVKYDERMCSGSQIKFGLCEGSSLEFQYFDKPNINGKQLQTFIDVQYIDEAYTYENVLQFSKYLIENVETAGKYRVYCATQNGFDYVWLGRGGSSTQYTPTVDDNGTYFVIDCEAGDSLEVEWEGHVYDTFLQSMTPIYVESTYTIPMGFFTVAQCPVQFSTGIRKATAYNKLKSEYLDQKANDLLIDARDSYDSHYVKTSSITLNAVINKALSEYGITEYKTDVKLGIPNYLRQTISMPQNEAPLYDENGERTGQWVHYYEPSVAFGVMDESLLQYDSNLSLWYVPGYWKVNIKCEAFYEEYRKFIQQVADDLEMSNTYIKYRTDELFSFVDYFVNKVANVAQGYSRTDFRLYSYNANFPWDTDVTDAESPLMSPLACAPSGSTTAGIDAKTIAILRYLPTLFHVDTSPTRGYSAQEEENARAIALELAKNLEFTLYKQLDSEIGDIVVSDTDLESYPDVTLRNLQSAIFETECQFGKLDRVTDLFSGVELNTAALLPRDDLYPANDLYPGGLMDRSIKSAYSKLWTDTVGEQTFRNLIIKYKGLDENQQEKEFELQRTVNANGTTDYYMSDNWLFKNLVWTAEQIGTYADAMVAKMQGVKWFPFELWGAGLPYLETGDEIEIITADGSYTSYILQRQLSGIQNLQDTYINGELDIF